MHAAMQFLIRHGYPLVVLWVFAEQAGLPIPAAPVLVAAGVLAGTHQINLPMTVALSVLAAVFGDLIWYRAGRRKGQGVLRYVCKLSFNQDSCVRKTENAFTRYGLRSLLIAKFVPWLNTVAPTLSGAFGVPLSSFLFYDLFGALIWSVSLVGVGYVFAHKVEDLARYVDAFGTWLVPVLIVVGLIAYTIFKFVRRQRFLQQLRIARISPQELKLKLDSGENIAIIDLRHPLDFLPEPYTIPTAIRLSLEELRKRHEEVPRDRDVVLYCTCPNEASSAKVALMLQQMGVTRVRPLEGGYWGWRKLGYPLTSEFGPVPPLGSNRRNFWSHAVAS